MRCWDLQYLTPYNSALAEQSQCEKLEQIAEGH
jgi:hypothetical protein